jgi:hypothetical protein
VIFDKMQGGPTDFIAESHCAVRSWKNFSLKQEQGEASGIAGKSRGTAGLQRRPDQGSRDFSPDHNLFARSDGTTESVSAVRKNAGINYCVILSYYSTDDCGSGIRGPSRFEQVYLKYCYKKTFTVYCKRRRSIFAHYFIPLPFVVKKRRRQLSPTSPTEGVG